MIYDELVAELLFDPLAEFDSEHAEQDAA